MNELTSIDTNQLATIDTSRIDENPAVVYLASLSPGSRRVMERSLTVMAQILTSNESGVCVPCVQRFRTLLT